MKSKLEKYLEEEKVFDHILNKNYEKIFKTACRKYFQKNHYDLDDEDMKYVKESGMDNLFMFDKLMQKQRKENGLNEVTEF